MEELRIDTNNMPRLYVIRGNGNHGKTTMIWMILLELKRRGAVIDKICRNFFNGIPYIPVPTVPQEDDFYAEVKWKGRLIILNSMGDAPRPVDDMLQHVLPMSPSCIVCASRSQCRYNSTWNLFETKYTNILYNRACVWPEFSANEADKLKVKEFAVDVIINSMA